MSKHRAWRMAASAFILALLGWIGYQWVVVGQRARALSALQSRVQRWGGQVFPDQPYQPTLAKLRPWLGNKVYQSLVGNQGMIVGSNRIDASKEELADLLKAPPIHRANLEGSKNLDDEWILSIDPTSSMFQLGVAGTSVTDRSVPKLLEMQSLASLDLTDTAISDSAVKQLRVLPNLRAMYVGGPNLKAIRLIKVGVFDDSGQLAVNTGQRLHIRGRIQVDDASVRLNKVRIMVRSSGDQPSWRGRPYGWNTSINKEGKLVDESIGQWSFDELLPGIPVGQSSVEVWVEERISGAGTLFYRMEPAPLELSAKAAEPASAVSDPSPAR
jgi:hypothetical protein